MASDGGSSTAGLAAGLVGSWHFSRRRSSISSSRSNRGWWRRLPERDGNATPRLLVLWTREEGEMATDGKINAGSSPPPISLAPSCPPGPPGSPAVSALPHHCIRRQARHDAGGAGTAPDIAGGGTANPLALMLSTALLLNWFLVAPEDQDRGLSRDSAASRSRCQQRDR